MTKEKTNIILLHIIINIEQCKSQNRRCTQVPLKCKEDQICQNHCLHLYYIIYVAMHWYFSIVCRVSGWLSTCTVQVILVCVSICLYTYCVHLIAVWRKASLSTRMLLCFSICICFIVVWRLAFCIYRVLYEGLYRFYSLYILYTTFIAMVGKIDHYLMS